MTTSYTHLDRIRDIGSEANGFGHKTQGDVVAEQLTAKYQSLLQHLQQERDRLSLLLEVNNAAVSTGDLHELLNAASASLRRLTRHDYGSLCLYDAKTQRFQIHALDFPVSRGLLEEGLSVPVEDAPAGLALASRQPVFLTPTTLSSDSALSLLSASWLRACSPRIAYL
jgi:transcriptional regulator with GAF, ATPase, and Fis domain